MNARISTRRLDLDPMTPAFLRASVEGDVPQAERLLQLSLPSDWPDITPILKLRLAQLEDDPELQPWLLRAIRLRDTGAMIGHIGFHTAPGARYLQEWTLSGVEFGFAVFPAYQRQGYAREAAIALMQWAFETHGIQEFVVAVGRANTPSRALVSGLGFVRVGEHIDEIDGLEDVYLRNTATAI